ncbi:MAG: hypothetical protein EBR09_11285 [Proteobacteria bacterium]|nr:hypothetical protein [Pseudomonadota bacterium]
MAALASGGCSSHSAVTLTKCDSPKNARDVNQKSPDANSLSLTQDNSPESRDSAGLPLLRGYMDVSWTVNAEPKGHRCAMSLKPETDLEHVSIITAAHCLPKLNEATKSSFKFTLMVQIKNGFIPLEARSANLAKAITFSDKINEALRTESDGSQTRSWSGENGPELCKELTKQFKKGSQPGHKTACFSFHDLRIIDAQISEKNTNNLEIFKAAAKALNPESRWGIRNLPDSIDQDFSALRLASDVESIRKRNIRSIAFLSNPQYCSARQTDQSSQEPDVFCKMKRETIGRMFAIQKDELEKQALEIQSDTTTPLQVLREKYYSCPASPLSGSEEFSICTANLVAREAFRKLVHQSRETYDQFSKVNKSRLNFEDYLQIQTLARVNQQTHKITLLRLENKVTRSNLQDGSNSPVLLFDFDPNDNYFNFIKGDSGSTLNIFAGYPVAALSTVDGEETSGGASITPLPEAKSEDATQETVSCR